jgi:hypothetical protein
VRTALSFYRRADDALEILEKSLSRPNLDGEPGQWASVLAFLDVIGIVFSNSGTYGRRDAPRCFVCDTEIASELRGRDATTRLTEEINGEEPLLQRRGRTMNPRERRWMNVTATIIT